MVKFTMTKFRVKWFVISYLFHDLLKFPQSLCLRARERILFTLAYMGGRQALCGDLNEPLTVRYIPPAPQNTIHRVPTNGPMDNTLHVTILISDEWTTTTTTTDEYRRCRFRYHCSRCCCWCWCSSSLLWKQTTTIKTKTNNIVSFIVTFNLNAGNFANKNRTWHIMICIYSHFSFICLGSKKEVVFFASDVFVLFTHICTLSPCGAAQWGRFCKIKKQKQVNK